MLSSIKCPFFWFAIQSSVQNPSDSILHLCLEKAFVDKLLFMCIPYLVILKMYHRNDSLNKPPSGTLYIHDSEDRGWSTFSFIFQCYCLYSALTYSPISWNMALIMPVINSIFVWAA